MAPAQARQRHLVIYTAAMWGHLRGMLVQAADLVRVDSHLRISIILHVFLHKRGEKLLNTLEPSERARITLIDVGEDVPPAYPTAHNDVLIAEAAREWEKLRNVDGLLYDMFAWEAARVARAAGYTGPAFFYVISNPGCLWQKLEQMHGHEVIHHKGLPSYYEHELVPATFPVSLVEPEQKLRTWFHDSQDHAVFTYPHTLTPGSEDGFTKLAESRGCKYHGIGMAYAPDFWRAPISPRLSEPEVQAFLLGKEPKSVIFVSFGTLFTPTTPGSLETLVDALVAHGAPFIFVMAAGGFHMLPDHGAAVKQKEAVLNNPSIGWVVSHGGYNTLSEALIKRVPMIIWPMQAEQVPNAGWLSITLDVAFELLQTRDLLKGKKLYNYPNVEIVATQEALRKELDAVLGATLGPEGARKRANVERTGAQLLEEYDHASSSYYRELLNALS